MARKLINIKNSFGQYLLDTFGKDAIQRYCSIENIYDPFTLTKCNGTKVRIKRTYRQ